MQSHVLERARPAQADGIAGLLARYAAEGRLLPRNADEILENIRDFFVVRDREGALLGCCALKLYGADLAEIRSLAVAPVACGRGFGRELLASCEADASGYGITRVFALTYIPDFFLRQGYQLVDKESLPQKIWRDCLACAHFPNCDETAVLRIIGPDSLRPARSC
jgi:amino-acid N-acetyltransferase